MRRRLAETLERLALTFEQSARLADHHAERMRQQGNADVAARERRAAINARDCAERARREAHRLRWRTQMPARADLE